MAQEPLANRGVTSAGRSCAGSASVGVVHRARSPSPSKNSAWTSHHPRAVTTTLASARLTPGPCHGHHPFADAEGRTLVPCHWRTGGPIKLAGDNETGTGRHWRSRDGTSGHSSTPPPRGRGQPTRRIGVVAGKASNAPWGVETPHDRQTARHSGSTTHCHPPWSSPLVSRDGSRLVYAVKIEPRDAFEDAVATGQL